MHTVAGVDAIDTLGTEPTREHALRKATHADLDAILAIERCCFEQPWSRQHYRGEIDHPDRTIYLVPDGMSRRLLSFAACWRILDEIHLLRIATAPTHRRRGLATHLMRQLIAEGRNSAARSMLLEVRATNSSAIALYRKLGFRQLTRRRGYYDDGEDALLMEADLP